MSSYLSYLNPFSYGNSWIPSYGCRAPSEKDIRARLSSPLFVNISESQLQTIIKGLKPIPPKAPPIPESLFNFEPENYLNKIISFRDRTPSEIFQNLKQ